MCVRVGVRAIVYTCTYGRARGHPCVCIYVYVHACVRTCERACVRACVVRVCNLNRRQ